MKPTTIAFSGFAVLALIAAASPARALSLCDRPGAELSASQIQQCGQELRDHCPPPPGLTEDEAHKWQLHPFCVIHTTHGWDIIPGGRISPDEVLISVGDAPEVPLRRDGALRGAIVQGTISDLSAQHPDGDLSVALPASAAAHAPVLLYPLPRCAENGSCYGDFSSRTGLPKTKLVNGYYRANGTYVRGYYRSHR